VRSASKRFRAQPANAEAVLDHLGRLLEGGTGHAPA
jgi:hypothetical protein